jgi:hypothetical protein
VPRFYFHIHNSAGTTRDEEGTELPGLAAARDKALNGICSLLSEEVRHGSLDLRGRIDIAGANGEILSSVAFADAVEIQWDGEAS